ncbi:MAG: DUF4252 domain-containing protein [Steroidobacteraceae bacterium]
MRWLPSVSLSLLIALPAASFAQEGRVKLPDFSDLAKRATDSVVVTLDHDMLQAAAQFIPKGQGSAAANAAIGGLEGVYVRSFTFAHDNDYSRADVNSILEQLHAPAWSPIISVHETKQNEDVHIYLCRENGHTKGMVIVAAEPRELTIVNLVGDIDPAKLGQIGGHFGVPRLPLRTSPPTSTPPKG